MTENIQAFLIRRIFPPFIKLNERIGRRFSDTLFTVSIICIFLMQYLNHSNLMGTRFIYMFVPFCVFMGIAILTGLNSNMKPVRFCMPMMIFWCITGLFALLTGILICRDHLADFIVMMIILPVYAMVWSNQKDRLLQLLCNAVQISYAIIVLFDMFFFRVTTNYEGCFINPNRLSMVSTVAFAVSSTRFFTGRNIGTSIVSCVLAALSVGVILLTESRAGLVVVALCVIVELVVLMITRRKVLNNLIIKRILPAAIAVVIAVFATESVFDAAYGFSGLVSNPETVEEAVWEHQPQRYTRIKFTHSQSGSDVKKDNYTVELYSKADNTLLNGRKPIWKAYINACGFLGHSTDVPTPYIYNGAEYKAHNTPLQMAYSYGVPAGISYLIFNIIAGLAVLISTLKYKNEYSMFALIIAISFGAYSMIESLVSPVNQTPMLLYFLSLALVVCKPDEDEITNAIEHI